MNTSPSLNYKRPAMIGLLALLVLAGGSVAWATYAKISGAVIASGSVVVEGKPKSIQHLDGGIVRQINISAGDLVEEGQALIELDDTSIAANLSIYRGRIKDALIRKSRLVAELEDRTTFDIPSDLIDQMNLGETSSIVQQQVDLMDARRSTREGQFAQLDEKIQQFENQIAGVDGLILEKTNQIDFFAEDIKAMMTLVKKQLAASSQLRSLERAQSDMRGQIAEHNAEIARVKNSISETKISKLQVEREFREKVVSEVEQLEIKIDELRQQIQATEKQISRVVIKAPISGIIHELNIFTIGGVVQPGQVLMQIIPASDDLEIELSVDTQSIDQVFIGQRAIVRLPAFHQRTTPELDGEVVAISPSSVVDEKSGFSFYRLLVSVSDEEMKLLGNKKLVPGMPVEAFIPTSERTVLTYLTKPLMDHLEHAFREE